MILCLFLFLCSSVTAQDTTETWKQFDKSSKMTIYYDTTSVVRNDDVVGVWIKSVNTDNVTVKMLMELKEGRKIRIVRQECASEGISDHFPDGAFQDVRPDSAGELLYKLFF